MTRIINKCFSDKILFARIFNCNLINCQDVNQLKKSKIDHAGLTNVTWVTQETMRRRNSFDLSF